MSTEAAPQTDISAAMSTEKKKKTTRKSSILIKDNPKKPSSSKKGASKIKRKKTISEDAPKKTKPKSISKTPDKGKPKSGGSTLKKKKTAKKKHKLSPSKNTAQSTNVAETSSSWTCSECTYDNPANLDTCAMCESRKSKANGPKSSSKKVKKEKAPVKVKKEPVKITKESSEEEDDENEIDEDYDDQEDLDLDEEFDDANYDDPDWFDEPQDVIVSKPKFTVLTKEELSKRQLDMIENTASNLKINKWDAAILLYYFRWNENKLHARYWDEQKKVCSEAGVILKRKKKKGKKPEGMIECLICCDEFKATKLFTLKCGHGPYCNICWQQHMSLIANSMGAEGILNSGCMWPKCNVKLHHKHWRKLAEKKDFERFKYFFMKHYVDASPKLTECPSPSCDNVILCSDDIPGRPADQVECSCGRLFCFSCGLEQHNPVTCDQLTKWSERNNDDQESIKLVMATSKRCCHCGIPTVRIDGCNHMTCRKEKGGCGGEWCWMCRGDWKSHGEHTGGFYSCNKYEQSDAKKLDADAENMKADADRYLHYFNRFFSHDQAKKGIPALRQKAIDKSVEYREQTNSGNVDFFMEAVDLLQKCRHILKYTYVYGFYLPDGSKGKEFFEYLQANAEGITERLADQVNAPLTTLDITAFKNRIRVTNKFIENLVTGMEDGLGVEGLGKK